MGILGGEGGVGKAGTCWSGSLRRPAVFLDRDGVINRVLIKKGHPHPPGRVEELEILPGVKEAIDLLKAAGFLVIVVTNQPDVGRGTQRREVVEQMHGELRGWLKIDDLRVCYHDDRDGCLCRKPLPGMLMEAANVWGVDLAGSFMVGDRWRDISAGRAAGCPTFLIGDGYGETFPDAPDAVAGSLLEASERIIVACRHVAIVRHAESLGGESCLDYQTSRSRSSLTGPS